MEAQQHIIVRGKWGIGSVSFQFETFKWNPAGCIQASTRERVDQWPGWSSPEL